MKQPIDKPTLRRVIARLESLEKLAEMSPLARSVANLEGQKMEVLQNDIQRLKEAL